jgi:hypothetical protein
MALGQGVNIGSIGRAEIKKSQVIQRFEHSVSGLASPQASLLSSGKFSSHCPT